MGKTISNLESYSDGYGLKWIVDSVTSVKNYFNRPPINVVLLKSKEGLLIVDHEFLPDNAVILNADATTKVRIENPGKERGAIAFADAYYIDDELTLIVAFPLGKWPV